MHIRKAVYSDCSEIASVSAQAVLDDDISQCVFPYRHEHYHDFRSGFLRRCKKRLHSGMLMLVMITDEQDTEWDGRERVLAHAAAESSSHSTASSSWSDMINLSLLNVEDRLIWYLGLDKARSQPAYAEFLANIMKRGPLEPFKDYWDLELLVVDPKYQRRGIGGQLVREVQRVAAADNLPLLLVASEFGEGLYLKNGFQKLGRFVLAPPNARGEAMVWDPQTKILE